MYYNNINLFKCTTKDRYPLGLRQWCIKVFRMLLGINAALLFSSVKPHNKLVGCYNSTCLELPSALVFCSSSSFSSSPLASFACPGAPPKSLDEIDCQHMTDTEFVMSWSHNAAISVITHLVLKIIFCISIFNIFGCGLSRGYPF